MPTISGGHKSFYPQHKTSTKSYKVPGIARDSHGKIKRNPNAKKQFLKQYGYKSVPKGYEVDHIVPLWKGGSDTPGNMQLLNKSAHRQKSNKDNSERARLRKK